MKLIKLLSLFFIANVCSSYINAEEEANDKISFSGIPALGYDSDTGFGGGVVGNVYFYEKGFEPYKLSIGIKAYISTKLMNSHALTLDRINAFGLPWRLMGRVGFFSTIAENYCGRASDASCDQKRAQEIAEGLKLAGKEKDYFERHYFQNRFMNIFGDISSRYLLWQDNAKLELMTGYHGAYYLNRDFKQKGPYDRSLYSEDFKGTKLDGYLSMVDVGLMLDKRDIEASPTSGYWLEASVRGGASFIGSAWDFVGLNAAARFYLPLDNNHQLVVASQSIADLVFGDLPYDAMSRVGGSMYTNDFNAIGGQFVGRGIREKFFVGKVKALQQLEFRYNFWSFDLFNQNFLLTFAPFIDAGMTAWDFSRFTHDMKKLHMSFGSGLRALWNDNFVIRADMGLSPAENFAPRFYLVVGNVF